jgi:hypothetical protein
MSSFSLSLSLSLSLLLLLCPSYILLWRKVVTVLLLFVRAHLVFLSLLDCTGVHEALGIQSFGFVAN